jgi:hypothetical protein
MPSICIQEFEMTSKRLLVVFAYVGTLSALVLFNSPASTAQMPTPFNPVGTWFGNAKPIPPAPPGIFPEVVMNPTFFEDGNVIANDSQELNAGHTTAHGTWVRTGPYSIQVTFVWIQRDNSPTGYAGATKVRMNAHVVPPNTGKMLGTISAVLFLPGTDPLDPQDKGGIPLGVFQIEQLRRVRN